MTYDLSEIEHRYGPNVHILKDPCLATWLAKLCSPETFQPAINTLVSALYSGLLKVVMNVEFPQAHQRLATRMSKLHPENLLEADVLETQTRVVTVNLARAGTLPSHVCYDLLNNVLEPQMIRQDHISASRTTNATDQVTGTSLGGAKIGGDIENSIVLFPDPMGATGNTIASALDHYKSAVGGKAQKLLALHLIVTPEYLKTVTQAHPDLVIYAVRLDRGLSSKAVLHTVPGTNWSEERGLNDKHYIVPGGGGFGEIMNNSFV